MAVSGSNAGQSSPSSHSCISMQVTDLLYSKQAQLEEMAATRSVQQMAFERELAAARSEIERSARCVLLLGSASLPIPCQRML